MSPPPPAGRGAQLEWVRSTLLDRSVSGVVIAGRAGAGKTWLAAEVTGGLDPARFVVARAQATLAASELPYGAVAHLLPAGGGTDPAWAAGALRARDRDTLILVVDDAQWLDPESAALIRDVITRDKARLLATVRTDADVPAHVRALWRDGPVPRLELGPLSEAETARLLEDAVGGPVEAAGAHWLWRMTEGSPLFLRELVLAGALTEVRGVWCRATALPATQRLCDLIAARTRDLGEDERAAIELVAFGEPIERELLTGLTSAAAVDRLLAGRIITVTGGRGHGLVRLAHPLHGALLRERTGGLRTRSRLRRLAEAAEGAEAAGPRRREDVLRVAVWRMDGDSTVDPASTLAACGLAWAAYDLDLALRLGRAAMEAGGGFEAAVAVGTLLHFADRPAESEMVLRRVADDAGTDREHALLAIARARNLGAGLGRTDDACRLLTEATATVTAPEPRQELLVFTAWCRSLAGRCRESLELADRVRAAGTVSPRTAARLAAAEGHALALMGRTERSASTAGAALSTVRTWRDETPDCLAALVLARVTAGVLAGDLTAAEAAAGSALNVFGESGTWSGGLRMAAALRGRVCRMRGELESATRWCRDATARSGDGPDLLSGMCFGELAHAAALTGDAATAEAALAEGGRRSPQGYPGAGHALADARPWVLAVGGDVAGAIGAAMANADEARALGLCGLEVFALHDVVRLGGAERVATRLTALAGQVEGALAPLFARHAAAARDGDGLDAVAGAYGRLGLTLHAAEAAAQATAAHEAAGHARLARLSGARAWSTARRCEGAHTPALARMATPQLTSRQRQIAQLAVTGLGNRAIAARLGLSVRTVENHLLSAYERLDVSDRAGLTDLFGPPPHAHAKV